MGSSVAPGIPLLDADVDELHRIPIDTGIFEMQADGFASIYAAIRDRLIPLARTDWTIVAGRLFVGSQGGIVIRSKRKGNHVRRG